MSSKVRIPIKHKGALSDFGYSSKLPSEERHKALKKAVKEYGHTDVARRLTAVSTLQKNTNPTASKKFKADEHWVMREARKYAK